MKNLKSILKEAKSDLKEITTSSCESIGSMISQTFVIIDNMMESVAQYKMSGLNTDIDFFANVKIESDESLKLMIRNDTINKCSRNEKKCAGVWIFETCCKVPVYDAVAVFSSKHNEMIIAYNNLVQQLLSKFSSQAKDSVENHSSLIITAAPVKNF